MPIPPPDSQVQVIRYLLNGGFDGADTLLADPLRTTVLKAGAEACRNDAEQRTAQYGQLRGVTLFPPDVQSPKEGDESTNSGRVSYAKGYVMGLTYSVKFTHGHWLLSGLKLEGVGKLSIPEPSIMPRP